MKRVLFLAAALLAALTSCKMENPLLSESGLPFGAPAFDKIQDAHYMPAFQQAIAEGKAEVDAIVANPEAPTFENTVEALEYAGRGLEKVSGIFFNLLEAVNTDSLQAIAEEVTPLLTEYGLYISLNQPLFERVKAVWEQRDSLSLDTAQKRLLEDSYKGFIRSGANLEGEAKEKYGQLQEKLSLLSLKFGKNVLNATNAFTLELTDSCDLDGLPSFVIDMAAETAAAKGKEGWVFDLSYPSYGPFMQYSTRRDLREKMYRAYNTRSIGGEFDNTQVVRDIAGTRIEIANLLGYPTYADYALENRMAKTPEAVDAFLERLLRPAIAPARKEVATVERFARRHGFDGDKLMPWDFSYWSDQYKRAEYAFDETALKPYLSLESCIDAVLGLAGRLYGLSFEERKDIPVYHPEVKVFDVKEENGEHLALFYADFFPRDTKRGGAWMTEFRGQYTDRQGRDVRPLISIVTNFTKPTADAPSLLTHDELVTFLHEFGHALHGMLSRGRYPSQCGTSVARDFVELPSQIMENWAYEQEYLNTFARHYQSGELIPADLVEKIVKTKNYLSAYYHVRQLQFGLLDMGWHYRTELPAEDAVAFEKKTLAATAVIPSVPEAAISPSFSHIFSGGYSAGYYSYKWAEVLEADAFSRFAQEGIFNREVADSFRRNILEKGSSEDEAVLYRNFRGHDPEPEALLRKLEIIR